MTANIPADVVHAAQAAQAKWHVPASISLAQWALESGWGKHDLGCFNYFGMKSPCDQNGKPRGRFVTRTTREVDRKTGKDYYVSAPFIAFASAVEAFDRHAKLLATGAAYASARAKLPDVFAFADALTFRYATDPHYGRTLGAIITGAELRRFDANIVSVPQPDA